MLRSKILFGKVFLACVIYKLEIPCLSRLLGMAETQPTIHLHPVETFSIKCNVIMLEGGEEQDFHLFNF